MEDDEDNTVTRIDEKHSRKDDIPEKVENLTVTSDGLTDIGNKRLHNEDAFLSSNTKGLWVVADGVGGHNAGDFASQSVVTDLAKFKPEENIDDSIDTLEYIINKTNDQLVKKAAEMGEKSIIGSTIVLLHVNKTDGVLIWAGDSRVYRIRANEIELLTQDHSLINELIKMVILILRTLIHIPNRTK